MVHKPPALFVSNRHSSPHPAEHRNLSSCTLLVLVGRREGIAALKP